MKEYNYQEVEATTEQIFRKLGFPEDDARQITRILLRADLRGIKTHGLMRLKEYHRLQKLNKINARPVIRILHQTPSTALLDADRSLGMVAGTRAMHLAIEKARRVGTGWAGVRNSNHFGIAGAYAMMALEENMIGIAMTNANPLVAPTYSLKPLLGTNPIAVAIPAGEEPPFIADFATSPVSRGKLDVMHNQGESAPKGVLQDEQGQPTNEADILTRNGSIRTLGGGKESGGHKGYCMSALVDILSAVLPGANFGPTVTPTLGYLGGDRKSEEDRGIGHFFGAMRVDAFQTEKEFKQQMDHWIQVMRESDPVDGQERIVIPGEPEREHEEEYNYRQTIPLMDDVVEKVRKIGEELGVEMEF